MKFSLLTFLILVYLPDMLSQEYVFYCSNATGSFQVYAKNLSNEEITVITSNPEFNYWWVEPSPDGDELLMMRSPVGDGVENMFDYDSSQMVKSAFDGSSISVLLDYNENDWEAFGNPHWHPTEDRILFLAQPSNEFFIYTMDSNGNNVVKLTSQFSLDPHWSHSGDKIVFIGVNPNWTLPLPSFDDFEVFTADYSIEENAVSNIQQLTDDNRRDHDPCFSPDDQKIAFSSADKVNLTIARLTVIDLDGSNRVDLVNDNTTNGGPINWGSNNSIYYHNLNINVPPFTPFTAKAFDVNTNMNIDLFPSISEGYISPYYFKIPTSDVKTPVELESTIQIYPNPFSNRVFFKSNTYARKNVVIYNSLGSVISHFYFYDNYEMNLPKLKDGLIFYTIEAGGRFSSGTIVKN